MMGAEMELSDWSTPVLNMRVEWRCVMMVCGERCVVLIPKMLLSSAVWLDLVEVYK